VVRKAEIETAGKGHVAANPLHQEWRKSSRPKITNSRMWVHDWSS